VLGFLMGFPALRLGGHYLALATLALALAVPQLLKYKPSKAWTGGVQGIVLTSPSRRSPSGSSARASTPTAGCTSSRCWWRR
jgi:ABC-type branched-subunit amino acid transport system permease subunit